MTKSCAKSIQWLWSYFSSLQSSEPSNREIMIIYALFGRIASGNICNVTKWSVQITDRAGSDSEETETLTGSVLSLEGRLTFKYCWYHQADTEKEVKNLKRHCRSKCPRTRVGAVIASRELNVSFFILIKLRLAPFYKPLHKHIVLADISDSYTIIWTRTTEQLQGITISLFYYIEVSLCFSSLCPRRVTLPLHRVHFLMFLRCPIGPLVHCWDTLLVLLKAVNLSHLLSAVLDPAVRLVSVSGVSSKQ